jgi:shikimate dehydrogenase
LPSPELRLAIVGDPVSHSLSPAMHEAALHECGLSGSYKRVRTKPRQLAGMLDQLRRKGYDGFNVTIPHKESILPMLPTIDEPAQRIRAVNTVRLTDAGYRGYNTDSSGFERVIEALDHKSGPALILGAGGAARACIDVLMRSGWSVTIANRGSERLRSLPANTASMDLSDLRALQQAVNIADLVVNATPVGLNHLEESPLPDRIVFGRDAVVMDLVYVPLETRLLADAARAGCRVIDGLALLAAQAADSFEIWTDKRLPDEFFRQAAVEGELLTRARTFQYGQFGMPAGEEVI